MSGIGAKELWGTLRNNSQSKLEKQDDMIPFDVKVHFSTSQYSFLWVLHCIVQLPTVCHQACKSE